MSPKVAQILDRRNEIATHQKHLQTLEGDLSDQEKKELAEATKSETPAPAKPAGPSSPR